MLFIIADKAKARREDVKGVGVVRDKELKPEDDEASHTLGGTGEEGVPKGLRPSTLRFIPRAVALARMLPTLT